MEAIMDITIEKTNHSNAGSVDWEHLEFGKYVSDHMFVSNYKNGDWHDAQIVPFQDLTLSPIALALHYGQSIFEGMKAFRMENGRINIFRIDKHHERLNRSLHRMCMPPVPLELFSSSLIKLIGLDKKWVPATKDSALYLRPFVFASEARFGVKVSEEYKYIIVTGPVPILYQRPIKVKVEREFIRAAKGGTGYAKCAGNYGGAYYPTQLARQQGFDQVLWMDAFEHEFIEESGTMNLMFVIDGKLITPPLSDSILDGITRESLLQIAKNMGLEIEERPIGITELKKAYKENKLTEAFGAGTAAVIAPIGTIGIDDDLYEMPSYSNNSIMFRLKKELEDIRHGVKEDVYGWNTIIE